MIGASFLLHRRRRKAACAGAIVIPYIIVADGASHSAYRGLQNTIPSEGRKVNFAGDTTIHRSMLKRVGAARFLDFAYTRKDAAVAAEDVVAGRRIPSQNG